MDELKVGAVGYCPPTRFDVTEARRLVTEAYDAVVARFPDRPIAIVSGLTNVGVLALFYEEAVRRGWRTVGVTSPRALEHPLFPVDEQHIVGEDWGDESPLFVGMIDVLIRVGGGKQSHAEAAEVAASGRLVYAYDLAALAD